MLVGASRRRLVGLVAVASWLVLDGVGWEGIGYIGM